MSLKSKLYHCLLTLAKYSKGFSISSTSSNHIIPFNPLPLAAPTAWRAEICQEGSSGNFIGSLGRRMLSASWDLPLKSALVKSLISPDPKCFIMYRRAFWLSPGTDDPEEDVELESEEEESESYGIPAFSALFLSFSFFFSFFFFSFFFFFSLRFFFFFFFFSSSDESDQSSLSSSSLGGSSPPPPPPPPVTPALLLAAAPVLFDRGCSELEESFFGCGGGGGLSSVVLPDEPDGSGGGLPPAVVAPCWT